MRNMTTQQHQAVEDCRKILAAQFDAFVISTKCKDENLRSQIFHHWNGDITDVLGLSVLAQDRMTRIVNTPPSEPAP